MTPEQYFFTLNCFEKLSKLQKQIKKKYLFTTLILNDKNNQFFKLK